MTALRVYRDDEHPDDDDQQTLLALAEDTKLKTLRSKQSRGDYRRWVTRWEEFWRLMPEVFEVPKPGSKLKHRLANPVFYFPAITRTHLRIWRDFLTDPGEKRRSYAPLSAGMANKHVGGIISLLRCAQELELIDSVPSIQPLEAAPFKARKLYFQVTELNRLYEACGAATWPWKRGGQYRRNEPLEFTPATYWRAAIVLWTNFGFRTQELVRYERDERPLTWSNIWTEPETPSPAGRAVNEFGWLTYVPKKQDTAGHKSDPVVLPLNRCVRAHIESVRPPDWSGDMPLFPFPLASTDFYATFRIICDAAGVRPKRDPRSGKRPRFSPGHFRKTASSLLNLHCRGLGPVVTGHADRQHGLRDLVTAVAARHYDNPELWLVEQLNAFQQPEAFLRLKWDPHDRQQTLF